MRREQSPLYTTLLAGTQEHCREGTSVPVMYDDHEAALAVVAHLYATTDAGRIVIRHHDSIYRVVRIVPDERASSVLHCPS